MENNYWQNYINGAFCDGGAGTLSITNPATGEQMGVQARGDASDIDSAVMAAKACHESGVLTDMRPVELGRMVRKMGDYIMQHIDEIAPLFTFETGKPLWESRIEIEGAARYFEYYGNQAETIEGRTIPLGGAYIDFTLYEPFGVSAHIIPWNYPLEMTARSLAAALATGNACVVKTPELDPICVGYYIAQAAEYAGLPKGAVNLVCGQGKIAGAALSAHPHVNQIVFTGSVATGVAIGIQAAKNVVPCVLELGGKSAAILCDDADIESFTNDVRWGIYFNAGQVCSAMSRVIVPERLHDRLVESVTEMARRISVGAGIDRPEFGANMGAMISKPQRDSALKMCQQAIAQGAKPAFGGDKIGDESGAFLSPTIFTNVAPDMVIAREEAFAPVLSVIKCKDDNDAIKIANSTDYGLVGGIFTRDIDRALSMAKRIRAGQIFINEWYAGGVETPFGGYGKSGYGREKGREALWNYLQTKNIAIKIRGD